jgi:hypothetical protein
MKVHIYILFVPVAIGGDLHRNIQSRAGGDKQAIVTRRGSRADDAGRGWIGVRREEIGVDAEAGDVHPRSWDAVFPDHQISQGF